ncbi:MAG: hypothetical protein IID41_16390, partial [Planctomycetes bacterium]|nr:hypothetical protein [Planctomycetota bacterium]
MPEYGLTILLLFILFSCVYKKHVRDWWWFRFGVISFLVYLASHGLDVFANSFGFVVPPPMLSRLVVLLLSLSIVAALGGLVMACTKDAEEDSEHLRCLKCGYILKGLSEPRCP